MDDKTINTPGSITKEEDLINVEHNILPNTLVLESAHPFPGYHGSNLPENPAPNSIYIVTARRYDGEDLLRKGRKVRKIFPSTCDISYGEVRFRGNDYQFIRARGLDCFGCVLKLQEALSEEGVEFMKQKKFSGEALIRLQKFFRLEKVDDHIYRDLDEPRMHYFEIPEKPEWEFFRKITFYIRGNVENYTYDAALGALYLKDIADVVRIYGKDITIEQMQFIRKKYLYEIAHPDHLE
ncbi:MAG: hypothetical protein EA408_08365 [Marinilabiliales bacterium]|nr:MAG: hypothetical protein EA408_08365 [Marinilabiliales bacterium]